MLLAFYDFPGEHWVHLRTTNPIESTFATVRLRQRVTKGPGSRAAGIATAFKLIESVQHRWPAVNSAHFVALVRAGATFENGVLIERPDESTSGDTHATRRADPVMGQFASEALIPAHSSACRLSANTRI